MTVCVVTTSLGVQWFYPVIDPWRLPGPGPWAIATAFAYDGVVITIERNPGLSRCEMRIALASTLAEPKEIQAFNFFKDTFVDRIGSASLSLPTAMLITKRLPGQGCGVGTDTVVLCRYFAWPRGRTAMYTFLPDDFWDFWGGCSVTFTWVSDTRGSGLSGAQSPALMYPVVPFPDGTLMMDATGTGFLVVFGGTDFAADAGYIAALGLDTSAAVPFTPLQAFPADFTLVREWNRSEVYIVFGGAKFQIPNRIAIGGLPSESSTATLHTVPIDGALIDWGGAPRIIPSGGTAKLRTGPVDGTLIMEQHDQKVFLVNNGQLRWVRTPDVMDARCLPWRHVRTVPDGALAALPQGPDVT
ncbi:MAG: hypothetical protein ACXU87_11430 [Xanthobacteraceae bacterium]